MMTKQAALLVSASCASSLITALPTSLSNTITWYSCSQNSTIPYTCGNLTVPLDYSDPNSNKTLDLSLVKVSATNQPSQGSILFNPGGPGETGTDFVVEIGDALLT